MNLARPVLEVAPELVGAELYVDGVGGRIVEVEAYHHEDPASHGHLNRRTARNAAMFLRGGHVYVYRSYGIHWCMNVVCGPEDEAEAALIRALEPLAGIEEMRRRRGVEDMRALCSGPGKLCQALGVDRRLDGLSLDEPPFELRERAAVPEIATGPRIGISKATEFPWRFGIAGSPYLSRPLRRA